jgi:hypothetical protein
MLAKRFLFTLGILILSLFALVSGVDAALDHIARCPAQNSFVIYDEQGRTLFAYSGDLNDCNISLKPASSFAVPRFLHRT